MLTLTKLKDESDFNSPKWEGRLIFTAFTPTHAKLAASHFRVISHDNEITLTATGKQREVEEELESQAEYVKKWLEENDVMIYANIALQQEIASIKRDLGLAFRG
jgi:hypothetical protein